MRGVGASSRMASGSLGPLFWGLPPAIALGTVMARVLILTSLLVLIGFGAVGLGAERAAASLDDATAKLEAWDTTLADRKAAMKTITDAGIRSLPHIRALLKSKNWLARSDALTLASRIKAPDFASLIAAGLKDRNWWVRIRAAERAAELTGVDRAKVKPALEKALDDRIVRVRLAAYAALAKWEPDSKAVWDALDDPDPDVAYWAAHNCIESNQLEKLPLAARARLVGSLIETFRERGWQNIDRKSITAVLSLGQDVLYDAIAGEEMTVRRRAVSMLGSMAGAEAVGLMFRFLNDPDPTVRRTSIGLISSHCTSKSASRLLAIAESSSDQSVQYMVLAALGRLKYRPAIPHLLKMAAVRNSGQRGEAFKALAMMGDKTLAPKLIAMYKRETQSWQRTNMIDPIARLLREDGVAFLREAASDSNQSIRSHALYAARSYLKEKDRTSILLELIKNEDNDYVRQTAISNLSQAEAAKVIGLLIEVMKSGGPQSRRAAVRALGQSKSAAGVKAVIDAFETEQDPQVRMMMLSALARARAKQAIPALKKALTSDDARMRAAAISALSQFGDALDNDVIIRIVKTEEDTNVLMTCVHLMNQRGIRAAQLLPRFVKLMDSDSMQLRRAVLECVSRIEDVRATKILCAAIKNEEAERNRAAALEFLIARLAAKKIPAKTLVGPLGEAIQTENANARQRILSALASQMDRALAPMVLDVLKGDTEASVRLAAAKAIERVADKQIVPQLIDAAKAEEHTATLIVLIDVLAGIEDDRALPLFRAKLQSPETSVQATALRAIGRFRTSSLIPFYVERYKRSTSIDVRLTALRNMEGAGDRRTLETILSALKDDDPRIRRAALDIAAGFADTRLVIALADRLSEEGIGHEAVRTIADAVGKIRSTAVAGRLLAAAKKAEDAHSRMRIYIALGKTVDRRAIPVLAAAVREDASRDLTLVAIAGLAELGARDHAGLCLDVARRSTGRLSRAAASAAAGLDGKASFAYLADRFERGSEREKRFYAPLVAQADPERADVMFLAALADARDEALIAVLCSSLAAASDKNTAAVREIALGGFGPEARLGAVRFLGRGTSADARETLALMTEPGRAASVRAAALLQQMSVHKNAGSAGRRPPSLELAARWLDSSEPELRAAAAEALATYATLPVATRLIPLAGQDTDKGVRATAIRALGFMADNKQAEEVLIELLEAKDADASVAGVIRSLGRLRSHAAVAKLSKLTDLGELSVRVAAVEALGRIATADAVTAVEGAFQQPDIGRVRAAAALALGATGNAAYVPRLAEALKAAPGLGVRAACAEALGRLGGDAAGAALVEALKQDSALVREAAVRALAAFKGPRPAGVFKRMLNDNDVCVAQAAQRALAALPKGK